jgi:hypothetical protein
MSHGFGSTKQPDSCNARNFAANDSALISSLKIKPLRQERDFFAIAIGGRGLPALQSSLEFSPRRFPDLPHGTVSAVDRIAIGNWQSRDRVVGFWPFAGLNREANPSCVHPGKRPRH